MRQRLRSIIRKEFIQALRDPRMRSMLFMPPLIQLLIFGYAANLDVDTANIAWMDQDHTPAKPRAAARVRRLGPLHHRGDARERARRCRTLLDRGQVDGVIRVLPGFARDIDARPRHQRAGAAGRHQFQYGVAGVRLRRQTIAALFAAKRRCEASSASSMVGGTMTSGGPISMPVPQVLAQTRVWFNPDLKSRNYFIPGVVVNIIMLVTLSLTAMAIVREKEIGTMEQLMVTPIRPVELILGKTLPFVLVGYWECCW